MRKEKQLLLNEMKDKLNESKGFLITSYQGINPNVASDFRTAIIDTQSLFCVVKKRVFLKAVEQLGIKVDRETLKGHIGIVYAGNNPIATTKVVYKFKQENNQFFDVLGGQLEGEPCSSSQLKEIAMLPSHEEMRAQFVATLEAPLSGLVSVIELAMKGVISCIDQQVHKKESKH